MGGLYNHVNHESETVSRRASSELAHGLSETYLLIAALEDRDKDDFETHQRKAVRHLTVSRDLFGAAYEMLSDRMITETSEIAEVGRLLTQLRTLGHGPAFNNRDIALIPVSEIESMLGILDGTKFPKQPQEFKSFETVIEAERRLTKVGLLVARLAALDG